MKTHDLEVLLRLSGIEARVRAKNPKEWTRVVDWNPEKRYLPASVTAQEAAEMIEYLEKVLRML